MVSDRQEKKEERLSQRGIQAENVWIKTNKWRRGSTLAASASTKRLNLRCDLWLSCQYVE